MIGIYCASLLTIVNAHPALFPKVAEFNLFKTPKVGDDLVKVNLPPSLGAYNATLVNQQFYYQINLDIGTPPQTVGFTIDTGSSDLWVMAGSNPYCTNDPLNSTGINCTGSLYYPELSSTYHDLSTPFSISYGDHTMANGTMATDVMTIGDAKLDNMTFAVADVVNSSTCVFGIGFMGNEANAHIYRNGSGVYPTYFNVPTLMKEQELISTNAYSLWLNDVNAESGSILFGGVDRAKYAGDLYVLPMYNQYHQYINQPVQTRVVLNSVSADGCPLATFSLAVLLDSGTTFGYLPTEIVDAMGAALGFTYDETAGFYFGPKGQALRNVKDFELDFSGAPITVPTESLLIPVNGVGSNQTLKINGEEQSMLAVGITDNDYMYILGDVFLRSMYAVFDIDRYQIGLANAKLNVTSADIVTIGASIPGAIEAPRYAHTRVNSGSVSVHSFTPNMAAPTELSVEVGNSTAVITLHTPTATPKMLDRVARQAVPTQL